MIHNDISSVIGNTPLINLPFPEIQAKLLVKLESENPGKSVKDRLALSMINHLEEIEGINPDTHTLIEATSGNTGIALAMLCAAKGYKLVLVMPETMSLERRSMFKIYGAEIVLTPGPKGMKGAVAKAEELQYENRRTYVFTEQFKTEANAKIHYETTGPEIWRDTKGEVDILVVGVGTGGTITGAGKFLKEQKESIKLIAVEPKESPVISGGKPGPHKIQGIGAGFIPDVLDTKILDEVICIHSDEAMSMARILPKNYGIAVGISSGATAEAALRVSKRPENRGKTVVAILADHSERYISTGL